MARTKKEEKKKVAKEEKPKKRSPAPSSASFRGAVKKERVKKAIKKVEKKKEEVSEVLKVSETLGLEDLEKGDRYYQAEGRRKTSVARVRLWTKGGAEFSVNQKPLEQYFPALRLQKTVSAPLEIMNCFNKFKISTLVRGGGLSSQAEAIRHGLARALVLLNPNFRKRLKKAGFLKRDSRMRERKKFGLKRARRAPQWAKR